MWSTCNRHLTGHQTIHFQSKRHLWRGHVVGCILICDVPSLFSAWLETVFLLLLPVGLLSLLVLVCLRLSPTPCQVSGRTGRSVWKTSLFSVSILLALRRPHRKSLRSLSLLFLAGSIRLFPPLSLSRFFPLYSAILHHVLLSPVCTGMVNGSLN